jgi:triphosphatase
MAPRPHHSPPPSARNAGDAGGEARELEWQLSATDLGVVRHWLEGHSLVDELRIEPLSPQQLRDTYLDTEDWRVFRAGYALRIREEGRRIEATLKGLRSAREDVADRREITEALAEGTVKALAGANGSVGRRVRDVIGVKPLRKLFEVRTSRERFAVHNTDAAEEVGEVALDEAQFSRADGHRRPMILTRVELEAIGRNGATLEGLAARLRTECGLKPATENKFAAGLHSASLEPPRAAAADGEAEPVRPVMDASSRAGDFAAVALHRLLGEWQAHEPAARLGERPEALHALRVTGRRMDTVLSLFSAYLPAALGKSRPKLKRLLDALGAVRDADIRLETVTAFRGRLPQSDGTALDPLLRHLEAEREAARAAMLRALDAKRTHDWLERLPIRLSLTRPMPKSPAASPRSAAALRVVPDLIRRRYRKLRKCVRRLTPESPISQYHNVRVHTKKLRYALEMVAPTYAEPAEEMLATLLVLQGRLGTQHDSDEMARYLTHLAVHPPVEFGSRTLFLMGRLAELHARKASRLGGKIEKPWRRLRGKLWKALRARMKELRDEMPRSKSKGNGIDHLAVGDLHSASGTGGAALTASGR